MVVRGHFRHAVIEIVHRTEKQRARHIRHARRFEDRRLSFDGAELVRVNGRKAHADPAGFGHVQNGGVNDAEQDRNREIKYDRCDHREQKLADAGFESAAEYVADARPVVHAPGRDHENARERRERQPRHHAAEQEHGGEQEHRVKNAREPRLLAGLDRNARAGDRRRGGHAAEERQKNVADALRNQLLIGVELLALHARGGSAAEETLDHAKRRDRYDGREKGFNRRKIKRGKVQPVGKQQRAGNVADGGEGIHGEYARSDGREDNADERAGDARAPLFRPDDHDRHNEQPDERRLPVDVEAETAVGEQLFDVGQPLGRRAEEVVDLAERNDDRDAGRKAHDHGHRDEADEPPEPQHTGGQQQNAGGKAREKHALQPMRRHNADEHGAHRAGRAGDLVRRTAEQRDHDTGDDRRNKTRRRGSAGRNAEGERERQRHGAYREAGKNVLRQLCGVVAGKFSL